MWILALAFALVVIAAHNLGPEDTLVISYRVREWEPLLIALKKPDEPLAFLDAWMEAESGGNPCAIGDYGAKAPDGYPLEIGLFQLYNPDDLRLVGAESAKLRAYCSAGPNPQPTRPLTADEMTYHIKAGLAKVESCRKSADAMLTQTGAGPSWAPGAGPDYWRLVKLPHALPGAFHKFAAVARTLGRAPTSWVEFRAHYPWESDPRLQAREMKALNNAEQVGGVVPTPEVA